MNLIEAIKVAREVLQGKMIDPIRKREAYLVLAGLHAVLFDLQRLLDRGKE